MKRRFLKQLIHFIATSLACAAILFTVPLPENGPAGSEEQELWQEEQVDASNVQCGTTYVSLSDKDEWGKNED